MTRIMDEESLDDLLRWVEDDVRQSLSARGIDDVSCSRVRGRDPAVAASRVSDGRRALIELRDLVVASDGGVVEATLLVFRLSGRRWTRVPRRDHVGGSGVVWRNDGARSGFVEFEPECPAGTSALGAAVIEALDGIPTGGSGGR
ncbi:hypothetical protein [Demequina aestuarii]|uniref:hypothetical protein n=1 Tax=Demequina aestuarii TaxID=327095 RepID=UPI0007818E5E|nr:hypothetical protein [Demequina aestuarii]